MATPPNSAPRGRKLDSSSKSGQIRTLLATGMSVGDITKKVGCTPALVYNVKARTAGGGGKKPRGSGRPATTKASAAAAGLGGLAGLDGILAAVKGAERERANMRAALERIQAVIADALA